jgi:hypothetical protein
MTKDENNSDCERFIEKEKEVYEMELVLPRIGYGPICMKLLKEFINHHQLPEDLIVPNKSDSSQVCLAKIFDVMLRSMGEEKRKACIKDSITYLNDLPPSVR